MISEHLTGKEKMKNLIAILVFLSVLFSTGYCGNVVVNVSADGTVELTDSTIVEDSVLYDQSPVSYFSYSDKRIIRIVATGTITVYNDDIFTVVESYILNEGRLKARSSGIAQSAINWPSVSVTVCYITLYDIAELLSPNPMHTILGPDRPTLDYKQELDAILDSITNSLQIRH